MYRVTFFISLLGLSASLGTKMEEITQDAFSESNITLPFSIMREISKRNKLAEFKEYAEDIKKRGAVMLKDLSKLIIKDNGLDNNVSLNVESTIENFEKNIQDSRDFIARLDEKFDIEHVYMFMDLLETGCKLIYVKQKTFLQNLAMKKKFTYILEDGVLRLHHTIFEQTVSFKKHELLCLCKNYGICVPYSVFTNYFQYFIDEILLLPDIEIGMIINLLSEIVRSDNIFLRLVKSDEKTVLLVKVLFTNTYNIKQSIIALRNLLKKRHILFHAPEFKQKIRIQAVRALLDTIDKAFYFDHSGKFSIDIYGTIKAVRDWGTVKENFIFDNDKTDLNLCKSAIRNFINIIFKAINFKKNDINRYLINTIITETLGNGTSYENLFKNGFKGVYTLA